ncbi:hypothetical protein ASPVEDRAFT_243797 [Aspergillus versicolor CBS 583.65]|uniref:Uncharacterized protein n=1 Tax=Aspergillus versicolor CBS 583.65 TaxID=1036611 RepID=A0A1L9P4X9_ASPVE|nr:uncharacterized protein ASPVEDRAFT_243797 [Aspergillus versicolor CBS 583.65]OJI96558.1 hypothetical protein ASPVEDRAFT_243797 [Aspergillus versicolor CBS 583.65]
MGYIVHKQPSIRPKPNSLSSCFQLSTQVKPLVLFPLWILVITTSPRTKQTTGTLRLIAGLPSLDTLPFQAFDRLRH